MAGSQTASAAESRRVSTMEHVWMNLFWFANNVHWGALMAIVIPSQVEKYLGHKELNLPLVMVWGTIVAVVAHPWAGALSDRSRFKMGRRRPFLLIGTIFNVAALLFMATTRTLGWMAFAFIAVQFANNFANSPYVAIIADRVPENQRGRASGWYGLMGVLGTITGALVSGLLVDKTAPVARYNQQMLLVYSFLAVVQAAAVLLTWWQVEEEPGQGGPPLTWQEFKGLFWVNARKNPDFFWVYVTRFLMQQGQWAIFFYLQYYFEDVMHLPGERTVSSFNVAVMGAATLVTLVAGSLSDRYGRKVMVYIAGGLMTVVALIFAALPLPQLVMVAGALFGIGWGAFNSVDQAMATDVLPNKADYGKDLGIWQVASILPQVTGIVIGGLTLDVLRHLPNHQGYTILMLVTTVCFGLGTVFIRRVRGVR